MEELAGEFERQGHKAYIIPEGASNGIGTFGYLSCMQEILQQEKEMGVQFDTIVDAVGSGGTLAGLVLANRLYGLNKRIVGINVCDEQTFSSIVFPILCRKRRPIWRNPCRLLRRRSKYWMAMWAAAMR